MVQRLFKVSDSMKPLGAALPTQQNTAEYCTGIQHAQMCTEVAGRHFEPIL
jgi:hypothetical protein